MKEAPVNVGGAALGLMVTACVTGASHRDKSIPCQDASFAGVHFFKSHPYALIAVADGHGSASYARSELGAHFAVQSAAEAAARWIAFAVDCLDQNPEDWVANAQNDFGSRFARMLKQAWTRHVTEHLSSNPLEGPELTPDAMYQCYGTTIAMALVFHDQVYAGAIGDSAVIVVTDGEGDAKSIDWLAGGSASHLGLITDSLASDNAVSCWSHRVFALREVALLCAVTDGFTDSLRDVSEALRSLCRDRHERGLPWLVQQLPPFAHSACVLTHLLSVLRDEGY